MYSTLFAIVVLLIYIKLSYAYEHCKSYVEDGYVCVQYAVKEILYLPNFCPCIKRLIFTGKIF